MFYSLSLFFCVCACLSVLGANTLAMAQECELVANKSVKHPEWTAYRQYITVWKRRWCRARSLDNHNTKWTGSFCCLRVNTSIQCNSQDAMECACRCATAELSPQRLSGSHSEQPIAPRLTLIQAMWWCDARLLQLSPSADTNLFTSGVAVERPSSRACKWLVFFPMWMFFLNDAVHRGVHFDKWCEEKRRIELEVFLNCMYCGSGVGGGDISCEWLRWQAPSPRRYWPLDTADNNDARAQQLLSPAILRLQTHTQDTIGDKE